MKIFFVITALLIFSSANAQTQAPQPDPRIVEIDAALAARDYAKVFERGRQVISFEPNNFYVLTKMVQAGFNASQAGNQSLVTEAVALAKKALEQLDKGMVKNPAPLANVEAARTFHSIALATLLLEQSPDEAAARFLKLIKSDELKTEPTMYYYYGRALLKGEYQKSVSEFKNKYEGKPETPEAKALLARINEAVARIVDTYARAVALSSAPEQQSTRTEVMNQLMPIYKALHNNSDEGLQDFISNVLNQPMP
jgi:tetratricopeptide (TPR) repeat protein